MFPVLRTATMQQVTRARTLRSAFYEGIKSAVRHRLGKTSLDGIRVAIQG